jgi:hypothetical protein
VAICHLPFALLIAEVAIHQLIVNRETLHPGALARYSTKADYLFPAAGITSE